MNKVLEGMARTFFEELDKVTAEEAMSAALLWLADRMEENGELTTDCKCAAVSAYLAPGQNRRGVVEPVCLMKAISAALRAAAEGEK